MIYARLAQKNEVSQLVVCPIIFILFYDRDRQGEVFKVMTNASFLVLLVFPSFWKS